MTTAESVWLFRRWFIFISMLLGFGAVFFALHTHADWHAVAALMSCQALTAVLYIVAPSAEQIIRGIAEIVALRNGGGNAQQP